MSDNALAAAIAQVKARIAAAARRAGRDPAGVTLVAVTKTQPVASLLQAYQLGLRDFGENRIEEAASKIPAFKSLVGAQHNAPPSTFHLPPSTFHLIGHLQSRKAREAAALFDAVHSIDSVKLAQKLSRLCQEAGRVLPALLECNVSGEASKYGFPVPADPAFFAQVEAILALPGLRVEGLMTVAPIVDNPQQTRPFFARLRQLNEQLATRFGAEHFTQLSMGMTDDFEVAIEEGATLVRIGRAIFGGL